MNKDKLEDIIEKVNKARDSLSYNSPVVADRILRKVVEDLKKCQYDEDN